MPRSVKVCVVLAGVVFSAAGVRAQEAPAGEKITYADHVLPLFRQRCGSCHNANDKKGGLVVDNFAALMAGGSSGPSLEGGDPSASYLWSLVNHESEPKMPPNADKLPQPELDLIRMWIEGGLLETSDSTARIKKTKALAKIEVSTDRPANVAIPARYLGEPIVVSASANAATALAVSPWAPLAAVSGHHQISLWSTATFELLGVLPFPEGQPHVLKFSRNGSLLLAGGGRGGASGKVVVFDVASGERTFEIGDEYDIVLGADISPDHSQVALGGPKKMLRVYSTDTGELLYEMKKHTDWITTVEYSPDGVLLASGDRANGLIVWEAPTGREFYSLVGHQAAVTDVSWRPDSNALVSASEEGQIRLWEMTNGTQVRSWGAHGGAASVEYTRDGRLVSTGRDRIVRLWNGDGGQLAEFGGMTDLGLQAAFDSETERVLGGDWTGAVHVWSAQNGAPLGTLTTAPRPAAERLALLAPQAANADAQLAATIQALDALNQDAAVRRAAAEAAAAAQTAAEARFAEVAAMKQAADQLVAERTAALQQAEQALADARAAYEAAILAKDQSAMSASEAGTQAATVAAMEQEAAANAASLKTAAEQAAAAAQLTPEQQQALQAAQSAQQAAQLHKELIEAIRARLEQILAAPTAETAAATVPSGG